MRFLLGKALVLLTIALAFANAQCVASCAVSVPEPSAPPCHSQHHSNAGHCPQQHDLKPAAATFLQPADVATPPAAEVADAFQIVIAPGEFAPSRAEGSAPPLSLRI